MSGRSALEEVMSSSGDVVGLGDQIREMEIAMATPMSDDDMAHCLNDTAMPWKNLNTRAAMIWKPGPRQC